jgi:hypothetical protein
MPRPRCCFVAQSVARTIADSRAELGPLELPGRALAAGASLAAGGLEPEGGRRSGGRRRRSTRARGRARRPPRWSARRSLGGPVRHERSSSPATPDSGGVRSMIPAPPGSCCASGPKRGGSPEHHRLDAMPVGISHEGGVIRRVVVLSDPGRPLVDPPRPPAPPRGTDRSRRGWARRTPGGTPRPGDLASAPPSTSANGASPSNPSGP